MWYLASIFLITSTMTNQEIIEMFENTLHDGQCVRWKTEDCMINFCKNGEKYE